MNFIIALLLALSASHSSAFTAMNAVSDVFVANPATLKEGLMQAAFTFKLEDATAATWPTGTVYYAVSEKSSLAAGDLTDAIKGTVAAASGGGETEDITVTEANMKALAAKVVGKKFYVYASLTAEADIAGTNPAEVILTTDITANPNTRTEAQMQAEFAVTISNTDWANAEVFYIVSTDGALAAVPEDTDSRKSKGTASTGVVTVAIAAADMKKLTPLTDNKFYIYAGITSHDNAITKIPAVVTVTAPDFTMNTTVIRTANATTGYTTYIHLTESPKATPEWVVGTPKLHVVVSSVEGAASASVEKQITIATAGEAVVTLSLTDWATLNAATSPSTLYVYTSMTSATAAKSTLPRTISTIADVMALTTMPLVAGASAIRNIAVTPTSTLSIHGDAKLKLYFSTSLTENPAGITTTAEAPEGSATGTFNLAAFPIPDGWTLATTNLVYVYVSYLTTATTTVFLPHSVDITVEAGEFTFASDAVTTLSTAITNIVVTPSSTLDVKDTNEVTLYFSSTLVTDLTAVPAAQKATAAFDTPSYKVTSFTIPAAIVPTKDVPIFVYVTYVKNDAQSTVTQLLPFREIPVTQGADPDTFTITHDAVTEDSTEVANLVIKPVNDASWDKTTAGIDFNITSANGAKQVAGVAKFKDAATGWEATAAASLTGFTLVADAKLKVTVNKVKGGAPVTPFAEITIGAGAPKPKFTVDPTEVPESEFDDFTSFKVKKKTDTVGWTAPLTVILSPHDPDAETRTKDVKKTITTLDASGTDTITLDEADFTKLATTLEKGVVLYVYAAPGDETAALAAAPAKISFVEDPNKPAAFTVDPTGIDLKKVKDKVTLKVKETIAQGSQAAWATDVYAIVSKTAITAPPALTAMTKTEFETPVYKFEHDISKYDPKLKKGDKLYLYVTHSVTTQAPTGTFLDTPVVLTVSAAGRAAPLFSLLAVVLMCLVKLF